jgi:hypothetical protein
MGQSNARRIQFVPRVTVQNPKDSVIQDVDYTGFFSIGDIVDVIDVDAHGNRTPISGGAGRTIEAIDPNNSVVLDVTVDTSGASGTPMIEVREIDDVQESVDRLFRRKFEGDVQFILRQDILAQELNAPSAGKTTYDIGDASFWRAGDLVDVMADEGLVQSDATIESVNPNADAANNKSTIVINSVVDISTKTNPYILNKTITVQKAVLRNQERIDSVDQPVRNEYKGIGDGQNVAFEAANLFVQGSSHVRLDSGITRLGTAGTRAYLIQGTGDSELTFTSMILGLDGNKTKVRVQSGAGYTINVTGSFISGFTITINDNGASATSQGIADALNADADAKRLIQTRYGGDGTGPVSTFGPTSLANGLDDGTGDYAEIEQVFENLISSTGFKWICFHVRVSEPNRLSKPPQSSEEIVFDYSKAADNVDR